MTERALARPRATPARKVVTAAKATKSAKATKVTKAAGVRRIAVSGSQSGLGLAIRRRLEAGGAQVIGIDLPGKGAEVEADLSTAEGREAAVKGVLAPSTRATPASRSRSTSSARPDCSRACGRRSRRPAVPPPS